jgi:hypothetical protein
MSKKIDIKKVKFPVQAYNDYNSLHEDTKKKGEAGLRKYVFEVMQYATGTQKCTRSEWAAVQKNFKDTIKALNSKIAIDSSFSAFIFEHFQTFAKLTSTLIDKMQSQYKNADDEFITIKELIKDFLDAELEVTQHNPAQNLDYQYLFLQEKVGCEAISDIKMCNSIMEIFRFGNAEAYLAYLGEETDHELYKLFYTAVTNKLKSHDVHRPESALTNEDRQITSKEDAIKLATYNKNSTKELTLRNALEVEISCFQFLKKEQDLIEQSAGIVAIIEQEYLPELKTLLKTQQSCIVKKTYDNAGDAVEDSNTNFVIFDQDKLFIDTFSSAPNQEDYKARRIMEDLDSSGHIFVNYLVNNDSFKVFQKIDLKSWNVNNTFKDKVATLQQQMKHNTQEIFQKYAPTHLKYIDSFKYRCMFWFFKFKVAISFAVKYVTVTPLKWLARKLHIFEAWAYTISMYGTLPRTVAEVPSIIHANCNKHTHQAQQNASPPLKKQPTISVQAQSLPQAKRNQEIARAIRNLEQHTYYADIQDQGNITLLYKVKDQQRNIMFVCFDPNVGFNMISEDELIKTLQDPRKHEQELRFIKASDFLLKDKSFAKAIKNGSAPEHLIKQ